jgi:hypothetical protein
MFCRFIVARVPDRVGMRHPHFRSGECFADGSANPRPGPTGTSYKLIAVVGRIGNQTPLQRLKPASIRRFGRAEARPCEQIRDRSCATANLGTLSEGSPVLASNIMGQELCDEW